LSLCDEIIESQKARADLFKRLAAERSMVTVND